MWTTTFHVADDKSFSDVSPEKNNGSLSRQGRAPPVETGAVPPPFLRRTAAACALVLAPAHNGRALPAAAATTTYQGCVGVQDMPWAQELRGGSAARKAAWGERRPPGP